MIRAEAILQLNRKRGGVLKISASSHFGRNQKKLGTTKWVAWEFPGVLMRCWRLFAGQPVKPGWAGIGHRNGRGAGYAHPNSGR